MIGGARHGRRGPARARVIARGTCHGPWANGQWQSTGQKWRGHRPETRRRKRPRAANCQLANSFCHATVPFHTRPGGLGMGGAARPPMCFLNPRLAITRPRTVRRPRLRPRLVTAVGRRGRRGPQKHNTVVLAVSRWTSCCQPSTPRYTRRMGCCPRLGAPQMG